MYPFAIKQGEAPFAKSFDLLHFSRKGYSRAQYICQLIEGIWRVSCVSCARAKAKVDDLCVSARHMYTRVTHVCVFTIVTCVI
jgi:hypothetical protein